MASSALEASPRTKRRKGRRGLLLFALGLLFAITLAAPLGEGIAAVFWPYTAGGHTEWGAVLRVTNERYWMGYQDPDLLDLAPAQRALSETDNECEEKISQTALRDESVNNFATEELRAKLKALEFRDLTAIDSGPSLSALAELPYPVLGALEGCITVSILAPF